MPGCAPAVQDDPSDDGARRRPALPYRCHEGPSAWSTLPPRLPCGGHASGRTATHPPTHLDARWWPLRGRLLPLELATDAGRQHGLFGHEPEE